MERVVGAIPNQALPPLFLVCSLACQPAPDVQIDATSWGCGPESTERTVWFRSDTMLTSDKRSLPLAELERLREVILRAPKLTDESPRAILEQLGISPGTLEAHREEVVEALLGDLTSTMEMPRGFLDSRLSWSSIENKLFSNVLGRGWYSTQGLRIDVRIGGDPEILLRSSTARPGMLPWIIQAGEKRWESADIKIPEALSGFLDTSLAPHSMVGQLHYWRDAFWSDSWTWEEILGSSFAKDLSWHVCESIGEWSSVERRFVVETTVLGTVSGHALSLYCELSARNRSPIDEVQWWNPIEQKTPAFDWRALIGLWGQACTAVAREQWLSEWKESGTDRAICLSVFGLTGAIAEREVDASRQVWLHAGYSWPVDIKLLLLRGRSLVAIVYLDFVEPGSVIAFVSQQESDRHWLDLIDFDTRYPSSGLYYVFVGANGIPEERSVD